MNESSLISFNKTVQKTQISMWSKHKKNSLTKLASLSSLNKLRRSTFVKSNMHEIQEDNKKKEDDSNRRNKEERKL